MTVAVLVASREALGNVVVTVGSSTILPSVSSPSSDVSDTLLLLPGLLPVATTELLRLPV